MNKMHYKIDKLRRKYFWTPDLLHKAMPDFWCLEVILIYYTHHSAKTLKLFMVSLNSLLFSIQNLEQTLRLFQVYMIWLLFIFFKRRCNLLEKQLMITTILQFTEHLKLVGGKLTGFSLFTKSKLKSASNLFQKIFIFV